MQLLSYLAAFQHSLRQRLRIGAIYSDMSGIESYDSRSYQLVVHVRILDQGIFRISMNGVHRRIFSVRVYATYQRVFIRVDVRYGKTECTVLHFTVFIPFKIVGSRPSCQIAVTGAVYEHFSLAGCKAGLVGHNDCVHHSVLFHFDSSHGRKEEHVYTGLGH